MLGTIINAAAILLGGILGLTVARKLSLAQQNAIKGLLGILVVYVGLSTTWQAIHGSFGSVMKQLGIMMLSLMLGNFTGTLLRFQRGLNRVGRYAKERLSGSNADNANASRFSEGFVTCTLLFCVGPMALLGSLQDGLNGNFKTLAVKGVMDGLATLGLVPTLGWGVICAVIPVVAYQGTLTLLAKSLESWLNNAALVDSINATGGILVFCTSLIILEIKKVELANYLPSLIYAPLLTWWWR